MKPIMEKLGTALTKKMDSLKSESVKLSAAQWIACKKKAQVVDLWHAFQKSERNNGNGNYTSTFPFEGAATNGVEFWLYGSQIGMGVVLKKKLKELGIDADLNPTSSPVSAG